MVADVADFDAGSRKGRAVHLGERVRCPTALYFRFPGQYHTDEDRLRYGQYLLKDHAPSAHFPISPLAGRLESAAQNLEVSKLKR